MTFRSIQEKKEAHKLFQFLLGAGPGRFSHLGCDLGARLLADNGLIEIDGDRYHLTPNGHRLNVAEPVVVWSRLMQLAATAGVDDEADAPSCEANRASLTPG